MQDTMYLKIILIISAAVCTCAQRSHKLCHSYGCFDSSDTQLCLTLDGEEVYYANFKKEVLVWESRFPIAFRVSWAYKYAAFYRSLCKSSLEFWEQDKTATTKTREAPKILIYPRDEVIEEEENTLICFIDHFFPPVVNIKWTKNDVEVAQEDPFDKCLPNLDGTFHIFSTLKFVPKEGDIYSCTVEHEALEKPETKFWDVDKNIINTTESIGPTIFFGFASGFALLGVVTATFFFVKGKQFESS